MDRWYVMDLLLCGAWERKNAKDGVPRFGLERGRPPGCRYHACMSGPHPLEEAQRRVNELNYRKRKA